MKRKLQPLFFLLVLLISSLTNGQSISDNWFFGNHAGIHFDQYHVPSYEPGGQTSVISDQPVAGSEGVASISDANGQLLFYTDGRSLWRSDHSIYPNSSTPMILEGSSSSSQSAIITPRPGHPYEYFIYTVGAWGAIGNALGYTNDLCGHGINQYLVTVAQSLLTNITVSPPTRLFGGTDSLVCEKITTLCKFDSTRSFSGNYWLIAHGFGYTTTSPSIDISSNFYVWEITSSGAQIPSNPNIYTQKIGSSHSGYINNVAGYLKGSQNADRLALACAGSNSPWTDGFFELFRFDNVTGAITQPEKFPVNMNSLPIGMPYGVEFSPDGNFFYGSLRSQGVFQFNTATFSISKVSSTSTSAQGVFQALQLAGNGQIYVARFGQTHLSALNNVDDQAPTWIENTIDWGSSNPNDYCGSGLPNFVQCLTPALTDTCDKVDVRITKEQTGSCCYLVEISNNFEADYFSGVSITSNNLSINSVEKDNSCTWADIVYSSPTQVIFSKAGTSGGIPLNAAGLFQTLGTICFTGSGVDNITVRFITNPPKNDTVCPKIRTIEGCNIPTDTSCVALLNLTAECDGSTPEMKFKIKNNSNFTISSLTLYSQTPGVTVNPQFISIPDLLPGQTSPSFIETALSISNNAGTACFFFEACGRDTTPDSTGQYAIHCCMDSILYCVNIPDCAPCNISVAVTGKDSVNCCYNLTLTSSHQSPIGFVEFKGIGSTRFTLSTSWSIIPPVDSNYVRLQAPEGGISPGTYPDFATFCPKETSTPPHSVQITYSDLKGAIICTDTLIFEACTPSDTNTCCQFSGLIIPNGITPNDDGINDVFEILNVKHCCCISIKVYNRWGNLVYKDGDYKNDWKGTNQSGDKLVQGTYFVIIELPNGSQKGTYIDIRY